MLRNEDVLKKRTQDHIALFAAVLTQMKDLGNVLEELIGHGLVVCSILDGRTVLRKQDHLAKMS
jgi:hypothetical protein